MSVFPPAAARPLPVLLTARLAVRNLLRNPRDLLALAALPLALDIAASLLYLLVPLGNAGELGFFSLAGLWRLFIIFLSLFISSVFIVAWFRYQITGRRESPARLPFVVGRRELRYYFYFTVFAFSLFIPPMLVVTFAIPLAHLTGEPEIAMGVVGGFLVIVCVTIAIRASLFFPAMAMSRDRGYAASWRQTKGSSWRLFIVLVLLSIPYLAYFLLIPGQASGMATTIILLVVSAGVFYLQTALIVSALALAYTWLVESRGGTD